jgi:hypothetical protein
MKKIWLVYIIGLLGITFFAFGFSKKPPKVEIPVTPIAPPKPLVARWDGKRAEAPQWTAHLVEQINKSGLLNTTPKDIGNFCPQYKGNELRFWVYLVSSIAQLESNFNPNTTYKENFKNSKGQYVISTGLTQLSTESVAGYGYRGLSTDDLKEPLLNLEITVKILKHWMDRDHVLSEYSGGRWIGSGARYWSTMRTPKVNTIKTNTKALCK